MRLTKCDRCKNELPEHLVDKLTARNLESPKNVCAACLEQEIKELGITDFPFPKKKIARMRAEVEAFISRQKNKRNKNFLRAKKSARKFVRESRKRIDKSKQMN